ncbi:MAG: glutamate decarboxylase [Thermanaeromonas sp.]|uniref:glutamate decarboxylase n=1 Tax=Thermanaeromonas sp. TaxID=2003697 RepID=UPI002437C553|nr:glutamate decarboxylase [Thermanaeromonas sp.]MCG0278082.1 glutamate decarboxylase [Thermanaeromonas sp.]
MWTVVYIASSEKAATRLKEILTREGLLVKLRPVGTSHGENLGGYEILVPESEAEEAHEILSSALSR